MPQTGTKRGRPAKAAPAPRSQKRQKTQAQARKVGLDSLAWTPVELPDHMDDYEGFFGLEEIEDVQVVRDGKGTVSFETTKPEKVVKEAKDIEQEQEEAEEQEQEGEEAGSDAESWGGFSDEEGAAQEKVEDKAQEEKKPKSVLKKETKEQKAEREKAEKAEKKKKKENVQEKKKANERKKEADEVEVEDNEAGMPGIFDILMDRPMDDDDVGVDVSAWKPLGLSRDTLDALSQLKFSSPTPIQESSIPEILAGHDVIGKASTGSGKTLAFGLPIVETFLSLPADSPDRKRPLALIVSPTRELAHQITDHLKTLCSSGDFHAPSIATITGGLSVQKQRRQLETASIIVGTPGRLWEVISSGHGLLASLKRIRFLVVDEADRLLSEGHFKEMGEILNALERKDFNEGEDDASNDEEEEEAVQRQTLVFSATFHKGLQQKLAGKAKAGSELLSNQQSMEYLLKKLSFREEKPKFIDANPTKQMAAGLKEGLIECAGTEKDLYTYAVLLFHPKKRALVFTNSIAAVRRITPFLQNLNLPALPLHSQMPQKARLRSIEKFKERPGSILVATDVAARGLDIPGVELVVHYHLSRAADTYVHRSGRTARGDASGISIIICAPEEVAGVRRLVAKVHAQGKSKKNSHYIRTLDIDRRLVSRLKPRAILAKQLADAVAAKEKQHSENDFLREAAEDLGVEYDSDTFEQEARGKRGRGSQRKKKEKEARQMTKAEMAGLRAELKELLGQRINTGVSAKYLTSGGVDVQALLKGEGHMDFLGQVDGLGFEDEE